MVGCAVWVTALRSGAAAGLPTGVVRGGGVLGYPASVSSACHLPSLKPDAYCSPTCSAGASRPPDSFLSLSAPSPALTSITVCGTPRLFSSPCAVSHTTPQAKLYNVTG